MKNTSPSDPKTGPDERPESHESEVKADSTSNAGDSETLTQNISLAVENNKGSEDSTESKGSPEDSERNRKYLANLSLKEQIIFNKENFMRFVEKAKTLTMNWDKIKKYLQEKTYITDLPRNFDTVLHIHDQLFKRTPYRRFRRNWCEDEKNLLIWIVTMYCLLYEIDFSEIEDNHWKEISEMLWNRSKEECQIKWSYLVKSQAQNKPWSKEEDEILKELIRGNLDKISWNGIAKQLYKASGCKVVRLGRHCRERWVNHLNPSLKKGEWSKAEDVMLVEKILNFGGGKWAKISREIRGRTENAVKNRAYQILHSFPVFQNSNEIDFSSPEAKEKLNEILNYLQEKCHKEPNNSLAEFFTAQYTNSVPTMPAGPLMFTSSPLQSGPSLQGSVDLRQAFCEKIHKEASEIFENQSKLGADIKQAENLPVNSATLRSSSTSNYKNKIDSTSVSNTSINFSSQVNGNTPVFNNQFSLNHNQASYPNGNSESFTNLHFSNIMQSYPPKPSQAPQKVPQMSQQPLNVPNLGSNSFSLNQQPYNVLGGAMNNQNQIGRSEPQILTLPVQVATAGGPALTNQNFLIFTPANPMNPIQIIQSQAPSQNNQSFIQPISQLTQIPQLQTYLINPESLLNVSLNNLVNPVDMSKGPVQNVSLGNQPIGSNNIFSSHVDPNMNACGGANGNISSMPPFNMQAAGQGHLLNNTGAAAYNYPNGFNLMNGGGNNLFRDPANLNISQQNLGNIINMNNLSNGLTANALNGMLSGISGNNINLNSLAGLLKSTGMNPIATWNNQNQGQAGAQLHQQMSSQQLPLSISAMQSVPQAKIQPDFQSGKSSSVGFLMPNNKMIHEINYGASNHNSNNGFENINNLITSSLNSPGAVQAYQEKECKNSFSGNELDLNQKALNEEGNSSKSKQKRNHFQRMKKNSKNEGSRKQEKNSEEPYLEEAPQTKNSKRPRSILGSLMHESAEHEELSLAGKGSLKKKAKAK